MFKEKASNLLFLDLSQSHLKLKSFDFRKLRQSRAEKTERIFFESARQSKIFCYEQSGKRQNTKSILIKDNSTQELVRNASQHQESIADLPTARSQDFNLQSQQSLFTKKDSSLFPVSRKLQNKIFLQRLDQEELITDKGYKKQREEISAILKERIDQKSAQLKKKIEGLQKQSSRFDTIIKSLIPPDFSNENIVRSISSVNDKIITAQPSKYITLYEALYFEQLKKKQLLAKKRLSPVKNIQIESSKQTFLPYQREEFQKFALKELKRIPNFLQLEE